MAFVRIMHAYYGNKLQKFQLQIIDLKYSIVLKTFKSKSMTN